MAVQIGSSIGQQSPSHNPSSGEQTARLSCLQDALTLCPGDTVVRCELAALLEKLDQHEEALFNWKTVLARDPNSLKAHEGVARCRRRTGLAFRVRPVKEDRRC